MKVCTDSCLFGAWVADKIERKIIQPAKILDIGSGTGLLSLMLAQKSNAEINAVEIDENSFLETKENFAASQWNQRLHAFYTDIKNWSSSSKYDLIIANPPFFENDLKSATQHKNVAKHHDTLTLADLLNFIKKHLSNEGNFAVLLPFHRTEYFKKIAGQTGFYLIEELLVKQTPRHSFFRSLLFLGTQKTAITSNELIIKEDGNYTREFKRLLQDYYLNS
jgi:tRNA1Val (adenine37-N6)-methyltransferase